MAISFAGFISKWLRAQKRPATLPAQRSKVFSLPYRAFFLLRLSPGSKWFLEEIFYKWMPLTDPVCQIMMGNCLDLPGKVFPKQVFFSSLLWASFQGLLVLTGEITLVGSKVVSLGQWRRCWDLASVRKYIFFWHFPSQELRNLSNFKPKRFGSNIWL